MWLKLRFYNSLVHTTCTKLHCMDVCCSVLWHNDFCSKAHFSIYGMNGQHKASRILLRAICDMRWKDESSAYIYVLNAQQQMHIAFNADAPNTFSVYSTSNQILIWLRYPIEVQLSRLMTWSTTPETSPLMHSIEINSTMRFLCPPR